MQLNHTVFAFGHRRMDGAPEPGKFYLDAMKPFVDEALQSKKQVVIIHDISFGEVLPLTNAQKTILWRLNEQDGDHGKKMRAHLMGFVKHRIESANEFWREEVEHSGLAFLPWVGGLGIERHIDEMNAAGKRIHNLVQPLSADMAPLWWNCEILEGMLSDRPPESEPGQRYARALAKYINAKDETTLMLAEHVFGRDENALVIIPRSNWHTPMVRMFPEGKYLTQVRESLVSYASDPLSREVIRSYCALLDEKERAAQPVAKRA